MNFDIVSCSSGVPPEDETDEENVAHFENLIQGEKVVSIILSPRSSQQFTQSTLSPRSDQLIPNPSPTSTPSRSKISSTRESEPIASSSQSSFHHMDDLVEQAVMNQGQINSSIPSSQMKEPVFVQISQIKAKSLTSIKWNGNNDPYVVVSIGSWADETDVVWSAAETFTWPPLHIVGESDPDANEEVVFTVYNANLIRDDQVIGVGSIPLEGLPYGTSQEVNVEITEQGGKQRFRGTIVVHLLVQRKCDVSSPVQTTSHCNNHHVGKKEKMAQAGKILATSNSEEPPLAKPTQELNRIDNTIQTKKAQPKYDRTNSTDKMSKISGRGVSGNGASMKAVPNDSYAEDKEKSRDIAESRKQNSLSSKHKQESDGAIDEKLSKRTRNPPTTSSSLKDSQQPQYMTEKKLSHTSRPNKPSSRTHTLLAEEKESALHTAAMDEEEGLKKNQSGTSRKKSSSKKSSSKKHKKDLSTSEFIGNKVSVSPDIKRIIDKAYQLSLHEECSAIRLNTYETALVLDALNIELSASPKEFIPPATTTITDDIPDDISFRSSRSGVSGNSKDSVLLSLQSPPLLAAALSEFVREKNIVKRNMKTSRPFSLTEQQAIIASNHLISLVRGNWKQTRKLMLMAATNKGVSSEDNRTAYWGPHWMSKILSTLQMPPLPLPENSGEEFLNLTEKQIHAFVKPSILRTRCRLHVKLMQYLDQWWKEGSRPQDPLSAEIPECEDDDKLPISTTAAKKKSSRDIFDGDYVKIAKSESLLKAMMPIHRAYAWSATVEEMTYFCDLVGGMIGMTLKHPPYASKHLEAHGMKWVTFREDATVPHSNISILSSLREFEDSTVECVSGRCVYVPQFCLKKHTAPIPDASTPYSTKTKNLPISNLMNCDVTVGMKVRVLDIDSLYRAYERFDWWERPPASSLAGMAGRQGVIVSLPAPSGTDYKRYGVSVVTKQGEEIVDALPPDAMEDISVNISERVKPSLSSASAPSKQKTSPEVVTKKKFVEVKIPDHRKPTDTSIRNDFNFSNPIPTKVIPYVHLDPNAADTPDPAYNSYLDEDDREQGMFDMDAPNGGDESLPFPDPEPMTFAEIEEHIRLDARVKEANDGDMAAKVKGTRPLYRPITPSHIDKRKGSRGASAAGNVNKFTSAIPRGEVTETYSDTHNYGWMQKKVETVDDFEQRVPPPDDVQIDTKRTSTPPRKQRPQSANAARSSRKHYNNSPPRHHGRNVKMQTAELDLKFVASSPEEKNIPRFQHNINKSRARAEKEAIKKHRLDYEEDVQDNIVFFEGSGSEEGIDFGITGLGFTGAKASVLANNDIQESPKRYPKRPSSANKASKGAFPSKASLKNPNPRSSNHSNYDIKDNKLFVRSSKHHVPSSADDVGYRTDAEKAFLRRELKRTEKEVKAKEDSLVSQLKSLGITVQDLDISY